MKNFNRKNQQLALSPRANFSWNLVGKVSYAASRAFLLILIAKLGTAEMVGQYSLAFAVTAPVFMMTDLDLRSVLVTDAKNQYQFGHYMGLRGLMTLFALAVVAVLAIAQRNWTVGLCILLVGIAKCFEAVSDMLFGLMQRHERMDKLGTSLMLKSIFSILLMALLIWWQDSIVAGVAGVAVAYLAVLILYDLPATRPYASTRVLVDAKIFWRLLLVSLPLGIMLLFMSLNKNISNYFISAYLGSDALGYYSSMIYIMTTGSICIGALGQANNARLARLFSQGDNHGFARIASRMTMATLSLGLLMLAGSVLFGRQILTLLYQPEYAQYQNIFLVIMAASGISYTADILQVIIIATRKFMVQPYAYGGVLLGGLLLNFLLIPHGGLIGAAWCLFAASSLQFTVNLLILVVILHKRSGAIDPPIAKEKTNVCIRQIPFPPTEDMIRQWKDLLDCAHSDAAFSDPDWLMAWWKIYGEGREPLLLAAYLKGRLVGLFPLMTTRGRLGIECGFMGEPQAPRTDWAMLEDCAEEVIPELFQNLRSLSGGALFHFTGLSRESAAYSTILRQISESRHRHWISTAPSPTLSCQNQKFETYYRARFSSHAIKNNRRDEKRLALLGKVSYRELSVQDMPEAFRLHDERWKRKLDTSGFCDAPSRAFFTALLELSSGRIKTVALGLYLDERLIAFQYGFACGSRVCLYKSAHDDLLGIYAPGKMIKREWVRRCFEQGYQIVDFGIGYEDYKAEWTDEQESVESILWAKNDPLSQAQFALPYLKSMLRDQLKKSRKIILFKRNGLGKVRYFLSLESLREFASRIPSAIRSEKVPALLHGRAYDRQTMRLIALSPLADKAQLPTYEPTSSKLADVPELGRMMSLSQESIMRRFYRQHECFTVKSGGSVVCAAWVNGGESVEIYDLYHSNNCPIEAAQSLLGFIVSSRPPGIQTSLVLHKHDDIGRTAARMAGFRDIVPEKEPQTNMGHTERGISNAASNH